MKRFVLIGVLFLATPAFAEEDARQCPAQLISAETDGANLLRTVHAIGAQRDLLAKDNEGLKQANEALRKELETLKKPVEEPK